MDMFARDEEVAEWESALLPLRGAARLPVLVPLSWQLRQRDSERAVALAHEGLALLPAATSASTSATISASTSAPALSATEAALVAARLQLVLAEAAWLAGQLAEAEHLAHQIETELLAHQDHRGCADTHWLRAWIAIDDGDHQRGMTQLLNMAEAARRVGDEQRLAIAEAATARWAAFEDNRAAEEHWGQRFAPDPHTPPAVAAWVYDFFGTAASQGSKFGAGAGHFIRVYEAARETGQLRSAITAAVNIGLDFTILHDHHTALEWMQRALELARPTGWPRSIGACLTHTADTLRRLGRLDASREMLDEALRVLAPLPSGRSYASALHFLGDLSLDQADYSAALAAFEQLATRAAALRQTDLLSIARRGQAHALCFLERPDEALERAAEAVTLARRQSNLYNHVAALRVLAAIHGRHQLPAPDGMTEPNATLHYLRLALGLAAEITGYTLPAELHDALGHEYAALGRHQQAYEAVRAAAAAREKTHSQETTNRAIALQVHHQTEHARAEGLHHRQLAIAEAQRAEVLQQTSATLERLSVIGQEITAHLDSAAVFQALNRHVQALLPANTLAIYLCDPGVELLSRAFGIENGQPLAANTIAADNPRANAARCLRERREIYVEQVGPDDIFLAPGTEVMACALYMPLLVGERILGVMTVQAAHVRAYGERERLIFRTLCAYGAIALDNAEAYLQLKNAQAQLLSQEKLAALGALMAGVAHELNTPIGNSLLIASTLHQKTEDMAARLDGPGLRRSELAAYFDDAARAHALVMRGLTSAADLVNSFKQVAVDRTTEQRRRFDLQQVAGELIATMMNRIRAAGHRIEAELPPHIVLDSYPGPFGQVLANFINNALLHAFGGRPGGGRMWLRASTPHEGRALVVFGDNGGGIAAEHLSRIFDPFFTTKLGQGGSGLGLSISYNIVTALMGGSISVHSSAEGTSFSLDLPLTAPAPAATTTATQIYH